MDRGCVAAEPAFESRRGFTLLELMLVLAILVTLGAIAAPRLVDVFERQKLNGSASNLRLAFDQARLDAMQTGQAQVFACTLESNEYTIKPLMLQSDMANAGAGATVMTSAGTVVETQDTGMVQAADLSEVSEAEKLEEDISFVSCNVASDMRAYAVAQESQSSGTGDMSTQTVNSQIIFYPDGSTSTAEVQIKNNRGDVRAVRIRGLTGHSKIVALLNVPSGADTKKGDD